MSEIVINVVNNMTSKMIVEAISSGDHKRVSYFVLLKDIELELKNNIDASNVYTCEAGGFISHYRSCYKIFSEITKKVDKEECEKVIIRLPNIHHVFNNIMFFQGKNIFDCEVEYEVVSEGTLTYVGYIIGFRYIIQHVVKISISALFFRKLYRPFLGRFDGLDRKHKVAVLHVPSVKGLPELTCSVNCIDLNEQLNRRVNGGLYKSPIVLVVGQYLWVQIGKKRSSYINEKMIEYIISSGLGDGEVVYKPHPLKNDDDMLERVHRMGWTVLDRSEPIEHMVINYNIKALIGVGSTSLMLGKLIDNDLRCISYGMNYLDNKHFYDYSRLVKLFIEVGVECVSL